MSEWYEPGTIVRLNSGGPEMIVLRRHGDLYVCGWHTGSGEWCMDSFLAATIQRVAKP